MKLESSPPRDLPTGPTLGSPHSEYSSLFESAASSGRPHATMEETGGQYDRLTGAATKDVLASYDWYSGGPSAFSNMAMVRTTSASSLSGALGDSKMQYLPYAKAYLRRRSATATCSAFPPSSLSPTQRHQYLQPTGVGAVPAVGASLATAPTIPQSYRAPGPEPSSSHYPTSPPWGPTGLGSDVQELAPRWVGGARGPDEGSPPIPSGDHATRTTCP